MIFDKLFNSSNYCWNDKFKAAFDFLSNGNANTLEVGRYDIAEGVYANVSEFNTKSKQDLASEGHKNYIDIQYIADGNETMGFYCGKFYTVLDEYDADRDIFQAEARLQYVNLKRGEFAIFFPSDLHMPGIGNGERVRKIVVKIRI